MLYFEKGDIIRIKKKISLPREKIFNSNYRKDLYYNEIYGLIKADADQISIINDKLKNDYLTNIFKKTIWKFRQKNLAFLREKFNKDTNAFLLSIFFGIRSELDPEIYDQFKNTGMVHLLAISGLNFSFLGLLFLKIFKPFFSKSISLIITIIFLYFYIIIIFPSASSWRAFLMYLIYAIYFLSGQKTSSFTILSISAILLILTNPYQIFDVGFQLSFYATAGILLFSNYFKSILPDLLPESIKSTIAITLSAFLSILFIQWCYFKKVSFFSLFSSIFTVPAFTFYFSSVFFLLLFFIIFKFQFLGVLIEFFTNCFLKLINLLDYIPAQKLPEIPAFFGYICLPFLFFLIYFISRAKIRLNLNLFLTKNIVNLFSKKISK
jgi:competence protein ComEC